jgi:hypothetical protein
LSQSPPGPHLGYYHKRFISTSEYLAEYRVSAAQACGNLGYIGVVIYEFVATEVPPMEKILAEVA